MRVLLTRPHGESQAIAPRLEALGFTPVIAPVMAIAPLAVELPGGRPDALVVTSAHAIETLTAPQREPLLARPVYAVGEASAAAARNAGFRDVRVAAGDAAGLRDLIRLTHPASGRLLYLAGRVRKPELEAALAADGHAIEVLETYDARPLAWPDATLADLRQTAIAACLHFSRRSAELTLAAVAQADLAMLFDAASHICISDDTASPLRASPQRHVVTAAQPRLASLLQALVATLPQR